MGVKSIWHKSSMNFEKLFKQSQCPLYKSYINCVSKLRSTRWSKHLGSLSSVAWFPRGVSGSAGCIGIPSGTSTARAPDTWLGFLVVCQALPGVKTSCPHCTGTWHLSDLYECVMRGSQHWHEVDSRYLGQTLAFLHWYSQLLVIVT